MGTNFFGLNRGKLIKLELELYTEIKKKFKTWNSNK